MSPSHHAPAKNPRASRLALLVYAVSGVVGVIGVFAAVQPGQPMGDLARPPVLAPRVADLDARTLVGVWRSGSDVVVLDAFGFGSACVSTRPARFGWSVRGPEVVMVDGNILGVIRNGRLDIDGQLFAPAEQTKSEQKEAPLTKDEPAVEFGGEL